MEVKFSKEEAMRKQPTDKELKNMGLTRTEFNIIDAGMRDAKAGRIYPRIKEPDLWKDGDYDEF